MAKKKNQVYFRKLEDMKAVDILVEEVEAALGDETRILSDSKLAMELDKVRKASKIQAVGVGGAAAAVAGAGAAGAAYFGPVVPLIVSTTAVTGLIAWPLIVTGGAVVAVGSAVGGIIHSKQKKKIEQQLWATKTRYMTELSKLQKRLEKQRRLESRAVKERLDLLDNLAFALEKTQKELESDLKNRAVNRAEKAKG